MSSTIQASKILVSAEIHGCGVYLANERLNCTITFTNQGSSAETVAWVGAQIHCQACVREDIVKLDASQISTQSHSSAETAFIPNRGCSRDALHGLPLNLVIVCVQERKAPLFVRLPPQCCSVTWF